MLEPHEAQVRVSGFVEESIVDGPGIRFTLFTQGCPHHCDGCHNSHTHDFDGGTMMSVSDILAKIRDNDLVWGVTFSGGEPFAQAPSMAVLAREVKALGKHLMVYSGYTYEQLCHMSDPDVDAILHTADLLVDGRFIQEQKSLSLRFRGSANQRVIDLPATAHAGEVVISHYANRD